MKNYPNFFIVGAAKSGTTALYNFLKQHPDIYMPRKKELRYFGTDLFDRYTHIKEFWRPSKKEYLEYFSKASKEKMLGEATPYYLLSKTAPLEMKKICQNVKIIIILRNPIEVLYAAHRQALYDGSENIHDFFIAIDSDQIYRNKIEGSTNKTYVDKKYYWDLIKYSEQISCYIAAFGKANVKIIIYDDFIFDNLTIYREVLNFLNVDVSFEPNFNKVNTNKEIKSFFVHNLIKNPPLCLQTMINIIPENVRKILKTSLLNMNTTSTERPPLDIEEKEKLQDKLIPEIIVLSNLLDRDLSHWYS